MPFSKVITSFFVKYFVNRSKDSLLNSQAAFLDMALAAIKKEITDLIFKIAMASVAVGVLIYSLIVLGQHFHAYMLIYEKGTLYSVLFYSLLSIACAFIVYRLFYDQKNPYNIFESFFLQKKEKNINFEKIYSLFLDGLSEGMGASKSEEWEEQKKADESQDSELPH